VTKGAFLAEKFAPCERNGDFTFNACDVTGELASKSVMRWGREKQNADQISRRGINQSQRAA